MRPRKYHSKCEVMEGINQDFLLYRKATVREYILE